MSSNNDQIEVSSLPLSWPDDPNDTRGLKRPPTSAKSSVKINVVSTPLDLDDDPIYLEKDSPTKSLSYDYDGDDNDIEHPGYELESITDSSSMSGGSDNSKKHRLGRCCCASSCCSSSCRCCSQRTYCLSSLLIILILIVTGLCLGLLGPWRNDPTQNDLSFEYQSDCSSNNNGQEINCCNGLPSNCFLKLNEVVFAASHNAMANKEDGNYLAAYNHFNSIEESLDAGYRAFLLDLCDCDGTDSNSTGLQLCHGTCQLGTTEPAKVLKTIRDFLVDNPSEVILLELQVVHNKNGGGNSLLSMFSDVMTKSDDVDGIAELMYNHPAQHLDWPRMNELIRNNTRLIIFQHNGPDCNVEGQCPYGFHNLYTYAFESPWDLKKEEILDGNYKKSCRILERGAYKAERNNTFFLLNHFANNRFGLPDSSIANEINGKSILEPRINECEELVGRLVNIIAVDYWSLGDVPEVTKQLNMRNGVTFSPSSAPSTSPTFEPTNQPSIRPTSQPTTQPSSQPTSYPTIYPTTIPTLPPTTVSPTSTILPTASPSAAPSMTTSPTTVGSFDTFPGFPTSLPTATDEDIVSAEFPTSQPTELDEDVVPAEFPTSQPTELVFTNVPSSSTTFLTMDDPTSYPTMLETKAPSRAIIDIPAYNPSASASTPSPSRGVPTFPLYTNSPSRSVQIHPIPLNTISVKQSCYFNVTDTCTLVEADCKEDSPCPDGGVCIDNSDFSFECGQRQCKNIANNSCNGEECRSDDDCIIKFGENTACVSSSNGCAIGV